MKRILYGLLRLTSGIRHYTVRRLKPAGWLLFSGLLVTEIIGFDTNRNMAYQAFTFFLTVFVTAIVINLFFRVKVSAERIFPRFGTAGHPLPYRIRIKNLGTSWLRGLEILENFVDPRPRYKDIADSPLGITKAWKAHIQSRQTADPAQIPLQDIPPRIEMEVPAEIMPVRRGRVEMTSMSFSRTDPFGILRSFVNVADHQSILILPKRYRVPDLGLPGNRSYQQGGVVLSTSVADAEEFQSLREYRAGDPLRLIHWKSWARTGKPVIKEFQEEFFVRHALVLDTFASNGGEIFEEAVSVAASFASTVQTQDSLLDLMFVGTEAYVETIGRGQGQTERLLEVLAGVRICQARPFEVLRTLVLSRRAYMSGCVCVLIAWDRDREEFLRHLHSLGVTTRVFLITDAGRSNIAGYNADKELPIWLTLLTAGKIEQDLALI